MKSVTLNNDQQLYIIPCGEGYSCLGFQVLEDQAKLLAKELGVEWVSAEPSVERYDEYFALIQKASLKMATGWRSKSQLTPQLVGLEQKRVEVVDCDGEKRRFIVGKSTGGIPCHLEIARRNSSGGLAVMGMPFKSVRVVG